MVIQIIGMFTGYGPSMWLGSPWLQHSKEAESEWLYAEGKRQGMTYSHEN